MCGHTRRFQTASPGHPAEGETVRLGSLERGEGRSCGAGFPWWTLWMLWPLFWLVKGAFVLAAPLYAWLSQPVVLAVTPLPLLLVCAGLAILLIGGLRRRRD